MPKKPLIYIERFMFPLIIFLSAITIRIIYIITSVNNPFFTNPIVDMKYNWSFSSQLLYKGFLSMPENMMSWKPYLYPCYLAVIRLFTGDSMLATQVFQSILGAVNCVLLYFLARTRFSIRASFISGMIMACYGTFVFYDSTFLSVTLDLFFTIIMLIYVSKFNKDTKEIKWMIPGIFLAFGAKTHQIVLVYIVAIPVIIYFWYKESKIDVKPIAKKIYQVVAKRFIYFLIGFFLIIGPLSLLSFSKDSSFAVASDNGGVNFYIGNNKNADGISVPPLGVAWTRLINEPIFKSGWTGDNSSYFYRKAFNDILHSPSSFVKLYAKKIMYLFSAVEIKNNVNMDIYRQYSGILKGLLWESPYLAFPFGIIFPLSVIGIILSFRRNFSEYMHFYLFLVVISLGIALFFVCARYRMLLIPVLIMFAAFSIDTCAAFLKNGKFKLKHLSYIFGFVTLVVLTNLNNSFLIGSNKAQEFLDYQQLAKSQLAYGNQSEAAETSAKKAIELNPSYVDSYFIMGGVQRAKGNPDKALEFLNIVSDKDPKFLDAREVKAEIFIEKGEYKKAEDELLHILFSEEDWYDYKTPTNSSQLLGNLYFEKLKDLPKAASFFERYIQFEPDGNLNENANLPNVKYFLSNFKDRDYSVMLGYLESVAKSKPDSPYVHIRIAEIYYKQNKYAEAEKELMRVDTNDMFVRKSLANMYLSLGNLYISVYKDKTKSGYFYDQYEKL